MDLSGIEVAAVGGRATTTTVGLGPGDAVLSGQVLGPDGPVAGATVHLERLVGDDVGVFDVTTAADGSWSAPPGPPPPAPIDPAAPPTPPTQPTTTQRPLGPTGILGGRYRVRAWRSPDLALTAPTLLFLGGAEKKQLPLQLARYAGLSVTSSVAPSPPVLGQPVNIAVLATTRSVDGNGVVRAVGVPNAALVLAAGAGWTVVRDPGQTDGGGRAVYQLRCRATGQQPLGVSVGGVQTFAIAIAACVPPPPVTTATTAGADTVPDGETTTTTVDVGDSSTTTTRRPTSTTRAGTTTT